MISEDPRQTPAFLASPGIFRCVHLIVLCLLLSVVPFAHDFPIQEGIGRGLTTVNMSLILFGWCAPAVPIATWIWSRMQKNLISPPPLTEHLAACSAMVSLGWICFPYWVNGVFHRTLEAGPPLASSMDPKDLAPFSWFGPLSGTVSLGMALVKVMNFLTAAILSLFVFLHLVRKQYTAALLVAVMVAISVYFLIGMQPYWIDWLMD